MLCWIRAIRNYTIKLAILDQAHSHTLRVRLIHGGKMLIGNGGLSRSVRFHTTWLWSIVILIIALTIIGFNLVNKRLDKLERLNEYTSDSRS